MYAIRRKPPVGLPAGGRIGRAARSCPHWYKGPRQQGRAPRIRPPCGAEGHYRRQCSQSPAAERAKAYRKRTKAYRNVPDRTETYRIVRDRTKTYRIVPIVSTQATGRTVFTVLHPRLRVFRVLFPAADADAAWGRTPPIRFSKSLLTYVLKETSGRQLQAAGPQPAARARTGGALSILTGGGAPLRAQTAQPGG